MSRRAAISTRSDSDGAAVVRAVTVIMGVVVGLTFLFGFGRSRRVRGFLMGVVVEPVAGAGVIGRWCVGFLGCARPLIMAGWGRVVRGRGEWLRGRSWRCWCRFRRCA